MKEGWCVEKFVTILRRDIFAVPSSVLPGVFLLFFFLTIASIGFLPTAHAETSETDLVLQRKLQLEQELQALEGQISGFELIIADKQREATTLERDIAIFDARIQKAKLAIRQRELTIKQLESGIQTRSEKIGGLLAKISREKDSLGELLRRVNEIDSTSLVEALLTYDELSDFFIDLDAFDSIQRAVQDSFEEIRTVKKNTEAEQEELRQRRGEELELRAIQELERQRMEEDERSKQRLLEATKGQEREYQKILTARKKDAAAIRGELFLLVGSPDIPFEKALELANLASEKTGVRPAFILGVIAEESNLGANIGTGNWKEDLSHSRCAKQREAFVEITDRLGLNPDVMPVSRKAWYGYCGGAMGPAQFIPTTWMLYEDLVAKATGHNPPSPWDPLDAFTASALLLRDNGAAAGTYTAERRAALRYLAGSNWQKPAYAFYGDDVMALADKYQKQIDILTQ
ncbi:MAG: lytic murein transglycosylase [Parcubacteria group bacterium]|nr:lytic murein transglycosylase [Parcubacteria group bacterium]